MTELRIFDCIQGTDEWHERRRGVVTASEFHRVLAKGEGKVRRSYMHTLAGEIVAGRVEPGYSNQYMARGKEDEGEAVCEYEALTGEIVTPCGFMRRGDVGCSPDGLVGADGQIEAKTKNYDLHIACLDKGDVPSMHVPQVQGALWVSQRKWLDFVSHSKGLPLFVKRVYPDLAYHARLKIEIEDFLAEISKTIERINNYQVHSVLRYSIRGAA
jgi:hypothetical protein